MEEAGREAGGGDDVARADLVDGGQDDLDDYEEVATDVSDTTASVEPFQIEDDELRLEATKVVDSLEARAELEGVQEEIAGAVSATESDALLDEVEEEASKVVEALDARALLLPHNVGLVKEQEKEEEQLLEKELLLVQEKDPEVSSQCLEVEPRIRSELEEFQESSDSEGSGDTSEPIAGLLVLPRDLASNMSEASSDSEDRSSIRGHMEGLSLSLGGLGAALDSEEPGIADYEFPSTDSETNNTDTEETGDTFFTEVPHGEQHEVGNHEIVNYGEVEVITISDAAATEKDALVTENEKDGFETLEPVVQIVYNELLDEWEPEIFPGLKKVEDKTQKENRNCEDDIEIESTAVQNNEEEDDTPADQLYEKKLGQEPEQWSGQKQEQSIEQHNVKPQEQEMIVQNNQNSSEWEPNKLMADVETLLHIVQEASPEKPSGQACPPNENASCPDWLAECAASGSPAGCGGQDQLTSDNTAAGRAGLKEGDGRDVLKTEEDSGLRSGQDMAAENCSELKEWLMVKEREFDEILGVGGGGGEVAGVGETDEEVKRETVEEGEMKDDDHTELMDELELQSEILRQITEKTVLASGENAIEVEKEATEEPVTVDEASEEVVSAAPSKKKKKKSNSKVAKEKKKVPKSPLLKRSEIQTCIDLHNACESADILQELIRPAVDFGSEEIRAIDHDKKEALEEEKEADSAVSPPSVKPQTCDRCQCESVSLTMLYARCCQTTRV